jgi:hypothetical protein
MKKKKRKRVSLRIAEIKRQNKGKNCPYMESKKFSSV